MEILNWAFWSYVAVIGGIYGILALGLYVQFSLGGLPNFGHVAFMAISAYTMAILIVRVGLPLPVAALFGLLASVTFGLILGVPALRLRADYLAIATVAGGEIVRHVAINFPEFTGGAIGSIGLNGPADIAMYNMEWQSFIRRLNNFLTGILGDNTPKDFSAALVVWALLLGLLASISILERSPWGRVLKAIREDEAAATAVGKNVFVYKLQTLVVGAILGGLAGILLACQIGVFAPDDYLPELTFYAYLILILGGLNRLWAIPLGAALFSLLYSGTRFLNFYPLSLIDSGSRAFLRLFLVGLLLVLFMSLRPQGLLGNRKELLLGK